SYYLHAPPTPERYTLSLHDALPISGGDGPRDHDLIAPHRVLGHFRARCRGELQERRAGVGGEADGIHPPREVLRDEPHPRPAPRSEEHTSELQSRGHLVCRLLLEKK